MKKLLILTDFSPAAHNAGLYALHLAQELKHSLILCNCWLSPTEAPGVAQVAWPLADDRLIKREVADQLKAEAKKLTEKRHEPGQLFPDLFNPPLACISEAGELTEVLAKITEDQPIAMVVMGLSGAGSLERLFIGSHTKNVVNKATYPVLLVPRDFIFRPIRRIAFATRLDKGDIAVLHSLAGLTKAFQAEIDICHVSDEKFEEGEDKFRADIFMSELCARVNYANIHYHHIKSMDVDHGLDWIYEHSQTDLVVMVHQHHGFLHRLFARSHTQQLAKHIDLPLLVFPPAEVLPCNADSQTRRCPDKTRRLPQPLN
ncbi:universal stress protein [Mucilaginibacter boryungensis]|uniref:Universal stress protein n=1 Tax=Mucilaginibacter boryungensis TaxID=768480 RepID=A0ABR9XMB5_9SPHI|nr:universal stress protein [Mucilaginibacter boryungensis]MBE9668526.1 universal stress protein [Mucilaginibacter boryungensis]